MIKAEEYSLNMGTFFEFEEEKITDSGFDFFIDVSLDSNNGVFRRYLVGNNPVNWIDPYGLATLETNMLGHYTTFDPRPEDPTGQPFSIETKNTIDAKHLRSHPGADGAFFTPDVNVVSDAGNYISYGPPGTYIDTGDKRGRDIHGGGKCKGKQGSQLPRQGWCATLGCTRGQNEDVQELARRIEDFKKRHPGVKIPYARY